MSPLGPGREADARTGKQEVHPLGQEYVRSVKRMQEQEIKKCIRWVRSVAGA